MKGPRFATNRRVLAEAGESVERFFAPGVLELGDKLGPVNWQFAANKKFDPADFAGFLALLPAEVEGRAIRHALEVRHASFADPDFVALAREHGVAVVVAGDSDYPQIADVTAPFVYARIMGTAGRGRRLRRARSPAGPSGRGPGRRGSPDDLETAARRRRRGRPRRLPLRDQRRQGRTRRPRWR